MQKPHIVWLDVVRLVAMFTVVCCHCTDPFNFYPGTAPDIDEIKFWGAAYGSVLRPCVPLFVMITGALLLPVRGETGSFYKKRIPRVLWPFLLWSVLYALFPWILGLLGFASETLITFFPYSGEDAMRQSLSVSLGYVAQIPFNFSPIAVHMWYIYLLIGLYLYLPVFSAWVESFPACATMVPAGMGHHPILALLPRVCQQLSVGHLFLECFRNALLLCRIQRLPAAGTLPATYGMESKQNAFGGNTSIYDRLCGDVYRLPPHNGQSCQHSRRIRIVLYLLFAQRIADDLPGFYVVQKGKREIRSDKKSIGTPYAVRLRCLHDTLFLCGTCRGIDTYVARTHSFANPRCLRPCFRSVVDISRHHPASVGPKSQICGRIKSKELSQNISIPI